MTIKSLPNRIGFYPVCAVDYLDPLRILKDHIDQLYFCDIRHVPRSTSRLSEIRNIVREENLPTPSFILGDALSAIKVLRPVDVFFHRRDSTGEGGSNLFLLGPDLIHSVVESIKPNGIIITDLSFVGRWCFDLARGTIPRHEVGGRLVRRSIDQPFEQHGLTVLNVS